MPVPGPGGQAPGLFGDPGRVATHEHAGVVALGRAQDSFDRSGLAHFPRFHYHHIIAKCRQKPEVVGHENHRAARLVLELAEERDDLCLQSRIERSGGFVGNQQIRAHHHCHRDGDSLALPARELVRIGAQPLLGFRHPDPGQHLGRETALQPRSTGATELDVRHLPTDR